eukprot:c20873_g2_i1 orf=492-782(+)
MGSPIYKLLDAEVPPSPGYRLMTVEEVLDPERSAEVTSFLEEQFSTPEITSLLEYLLGTQTYSKNVLKAGTKRDIQDFCGTYFDYETFPLFPNVKI